MEENYFDVQNAVYDALMKRHNEDETFCFTLRKNFNKDTYLNHFTGTEKSSYFSFSMWYIKNSYPGASIDPIVYRVILRNNYLKVEFQLHQTKTPDDPQNRAVLELIRNVDKALKSTNLSDKYDIVNNKPENRMFKVAVRPKQTCTNKEDLIAQLMLLIDDTTLLIDRELRPLVESDPEFDARRVSKLVFDEMVSNRHNRTEKLKKSLPTFEEVVEEVIALNNLEDHPLLQFGEINTGFVWVGDNSGLIGNKRAHYEIQYNPKNDESYALIHFEDEYCREIKERLEGQLPNNFSWYKWTKGEGIKIGGFEMSSRPETPAILFDKLKSAEEQLGDKLRLVLKKITPKKTQKMNTLNKILYGPPGTGKTYSTRKTALQIIEPDFNPKDPKALKVKYEAYLDEGRIVFTTFHQSFSYEDFIEGIKPTDPEKSEHLNYEIVPGIFKNLVNKSKRIEATKGNINWDSPRYFKMSLGGKNRPDLHDWCIENNVIALGWGGDKDLEELNNISEWGKYRDKFIAQFPWVKDDSRFHIQSSYAFLNMQKDDIVVVSRGNHIIDAIGVVKGEYYFDDKNPIDFCHFREVEWIAINLNASPERFFEKQISQMAIYEFFDRDIKRDAFKELTPEKRDKINDKPHVLIIDEINRGNVSAIFGELITLIEEDKREGMDNELRVTLPYSKKPFSVPSNLYIIGTMNTADRSVEALDTALRRRFTFEEMLPNSELLSPSAMLSRLMWKYESLDWKESPYLEKETFLKELFGIPDGDEWSRRVAIWDNRMRAQDQTNLTHLDELNSVSKFSFQELLDVLNARIEVLIDRDHTIGHAFFMNITSLDELRSVFANKVIPLLQEYFYGDYKKMEMVIGQYFFDQEKKKGKSNLFAATDEPYDVQTGIYELRNMDASDFNIIDAIDVLLNTKNMEEISLNP